MPDRLYAAAEGSVICSKHLLVAPGTYDLKMAARITEGDRIMTTEIPVVPADKPGELASHGVVLGDSLEQTIDQGFWNRAVRIPYRKDTPSHR